MHFYAHHGCFEEEQCIGTWFDVDVRLEVDTAQAQLTDDLSSTVSYLDVFQIVKQQMNCPSHLLEHVARRIADCILSSFTMVEQCHVTLRKLNPPLGGHLDAAGVEVSVKR
ncbi:MAG: dihydroneopterin aldolase [Bacteroidales bacterium]|nr:dihydroneopterin aldolase [Bacteroidales bacterium]